MGYPKKKRSAKNNPYKGFSQIDGEHPMKDRAFGSFVEYGARRRRGGKIPFFNFQLAQEMELIPKNHGEDLTTDLQQAILDTFAVMIVNEYDVLNNVKIPKTDQLDRRYMATRYLQMQHRSRTGLTSGDGRSLWNGHFKSKSGHYDISSCGTGATCLSPARAKTGKFFKSGDPSISYGCGYAELSEGITNAAFSEILHHSGIKTERTLAVIEFPGGFCITVRVGKNLVRPSHFFNHLKQSNFERLKAITDLYIERQVENKEWPKTALSKATKYQTLLQNQTKIFAEIAAVFEREYIFCWLDWDGDNILADGSIIDYGSIRQFGLFHHEYRFDDVERWSTNIKQQRQKSRYTIQTFAQMVDYLETGRRKPLNHFSKSAALKNFDKIFESKRLELLLEKCGFCSADVKFIMNRKRKTAAEFQRAFDYFERSKSKKGPIKVEDGVSWNAIFSMKDLLRELPRVLESQGDLTYVEFIELMRSSFATKADCRETKLRRDKFQLLIKKYKALIAHVASENGCTAEATLSRLVKNAEVKNPSARITGNGMVYVGDIIVPARKKMSFVEYQELLTKVVQQHAVNGVSAEYVRNTSTTKKVAKHLKLVSDIVDDNKEGL